MTSKEDIQKAYNEYVSTAEMWNANNTDVNVDRSKTFYKISHKLLGYLLISMEAYDKATREAWGPPPTG